MAAERSMRTAQKKSSSGLCFVPTTVKAYLDEATKAKPGPIVDASDGHAVVGEHRGVVYYTIGQKKGLGLYKSHLERYVIDLMAETNEVVVGTREMCRWRGLEANRRNFLTDDEHVPSRVEAQVRYRQKPEPATLTLLDGDAFRLEFDDPQFAVAKGQSAVIYAGDRLLGGGVITARSA
jgi:tRNA-specific 2-thiouridylase